MLILADQNSEGQSMTGNIRSKQPLVPSTHTSASVDGGGAEGLPDDCLADVGGNEERDSRAQTIALLEQLIQQQDNQTCNKELKKKHTGGLYRADSGRQAGVQDTCI